MDFGEIWGNAPLIGIVIVFIFLQFFLRKPKPEIMEREIVQNLLSEVSLNRALVETFHLRQKPKKLEVVSWQRHKNKLDFLQQPLQVALSDAFSMTEDFNQRVEAAKKFKSASYLVGIDIDKLKEPLAKSNEGLEEWLLRNVGTKDPTPKYPGFFDDLFGRRR
ncbi:hypothetical protein ACFLUU_03785 [Chloroflexota bacterium]